MKKTITDLMVIQDFNLVTFQSRLLSHIIAGWALHGSMCVALAHNGDTLYVQMVIQKER